MDSCNKHVIVARFESGQKDW